MSGQSNIVLANLYGRNAAGQMRPVAVSDAGVLSADPAVETLTDWTDVTAPTVVSLVGFTAFGDTCRGLIIGMRCANGSADSAVFAIETSEDGLRPAKSFKNEYLLAPGEHDVWESNMPLLRRYFRLTVQPLATGPCDVSFLVRRVPR